MTTNARDDETAHMSSCTRGIGSVVITMYLGAMAPVAYAMFTVYMFTLSRCKGRGTLRHVARKQEFSWGNDASHRVHEMVPINLGWFKKKLGWFQRFLRSRFLRKKNF